MNKETSKNVYTISGAIWNDDTRAVAGAVNGNARILKNVLERLEELEKKMQERSND